MTSLQRILQKLYPRLDNHRFLLHAKRVQSVLLNQESYVIPVVGSCTLNNGSILPQDSIAKLIQWNGYHLENNYYPDHAKWQRQSLMTVIPAAGAASRYFHEVIQWIQGEVPSFEKQKLFLEWGPSLLEDPYYTEFMNQKDELSEEAQGRLLCDLFMKAYYSRPKALIPTTLAKDSFLDLKIREQQNLLPCYRNLMILPPESLEDIPHSEWDVAYQELALHTLRFDDGGEPIQDAEDLSFVPGGHGELLSLFKDFVTQDPQIECLHIRNVDNVIGVQKEAVTCMNDLSALFLSIRRMAETLRQILSQYQEPPLDKSMLPMWLFIQKIYFELYQKSSSYGIGPQGFYTLLKEIFHWSEELKDSWNESDIWMKIKLKLDQPLCVMGMVSRENDDKGGGPVFAQMGDEKIKICLEMNHASDEDKKIYFEKSNTHFNPVIVFFEVRLGPDRKVIDFQNLMDSELWFLTQRPYKGQNVYYHETALYELLGNSQKTNLLFVDVPRNLFRPHKTFFESLGKSREDYGFE